MSRIYEALQRAELERKAAQESGIKTDAEPVAIPSIEEPHVAGGDVLLNDIAQHSWELFIPSFPTLVDRGAAVEQFRSLRSRVQQARYEAPLKTILISSGMPAEGKTFVAANLAMSLARNSVNRILLVDGDLRRPTIHRLLGAPNTPGLSEYLAGSAVLKDIMQRDRSTKTVEPATARSISNLTFIPAGKCGDNSSELAANHRIEKLVAALSPHFDWILIDSPPVLAVTDAVELARAADGVLLVARAGHTPFDVAQRAQAAFSNSRILGFVLNAVKDTPPSGAYNYYYGSDESGDNATHGKGKRKKG
jgi:capsular exopolysaccharide synthesis family protein